WRLADDAALLRFSRSDQVPDDNEAGRNADAGLQGSARGERTDSTNQLQSGPHCPLGIVLMRLGIAEIDEDTVAHIFGHEPAEAAHRLSDAFLISGDDLS